MRTPIVAGNWKMHLDRARAVALADGVRGVGGGGPEVLVCPPLVYLTTVAERLAGSPVGLGAQNVHWEDSGAHTGETSAAMLADVGCRYCCVGHSERRQAGETDEQVNAKLRALLTAGLTPILCVGETLAQREAGQAEAVVEQQVEAGLKLVSAAEAARVVVAYEPVWAIGTGVTATPEQAQAMHAHLRGALARRYDQALADGVRLLYGGSVKPANASGLFGQPDIDGGLVGGASLDASAFGEIVAAAR